MPGWLRPPKVGKAASRTMFSPLCASSSDALRFRYMKSRTTVRGTPTASAILPDGTMIELVYQPDGERTLLAAYQDDKVTFHETMEMPSGERLVPIAAQNNLIRHHAVLLPEQPDEYGSVAELVDEIETYLRRYVDLSPAFFGIATHYILLSWVYDAFNELPYLRLRGEPGSGKTRALIVIGSLCYKGFLASGASTVSPIFHTLDTFRGTFIFDEADFRFSDEKAELVKIFNNGNVRGFPVLRTAISAKREFDPQAFMVFGPKIVAMRHAFEDRALESRFITEEMGQRPMRPDIPINLPDIQQAEARALRNKLLMYRFQTLGTVQVDVGLVDPTLSSRLNQILVPLLSIIDDEQVRANIAAAARTLDRTLRSERAATPEAQLLEVLTEVLADSTRNAVPFAEITQSFAIRFGAEFERPITPRYLGSLLRTRLHLASYKTRGVYVVPVSEKSKVDALCPRYGVTIYPPTAG